MAAGSRGACPSGISAWLRSLLQLCAAWGPVRMYRLPLCLLGLPFLAALSSCGTTRTVEIDVGNAVYEIPRENIFADSLADSFGPSRLDGGRSLHLAFSSAEAAASIPGFQPMVRGAVGSFQADLTVIVSVPSEETRRGIISGTLNGGLWRGTGDYSGPSGDIRRIQRDEGGLGFRVYRSGIDDMWTLVDRDPRTSPDQPLPPFDALIAGCRNMTDDGRAYTCRRVVYAEPILIEYEVSAENIRDFRNIDGFIRSKLSSWRRPGSPGG